MRVPGSLLLSAALLLPAPGPIPVGDREDGGSSASPGPAAKVTREQQEAIDLGLRFLANAQDPSGGFPTKSGPSGPAKSADYQTAVTALSVLAFLGAGHGLSHGPYSATVSRGVQWLLRAQQPDGFIGFGNDDQSKMHGHGFATLALAEAYGTATGSRTPETGGRDQKARDLHDLSIRLEKGVQDAVTLIEAAQAEVGGWDYFRSSGGKSDHEGSVTVCQVQALQAASNRGFRVSRGRIDKARDYMRKSQIELGRACGAFKYKLSQESVDDPRQYTYALAAAGVTSLVGLGDYGRRKAVQDGIAFMQKKFAVPDQQTTPYFFYGSFYAVQAFHWTGGEGWERFWVPMRRNLLNAQTEDGSWIGRDTQVDLGRVYPTAFTLLMLEVPVEYLSIFAK